MPTVPTFDALFAVGQAEVQSRAESLTDWSAGSANDGWIGGAGVIVDLAIQVILDRWAARYIDTAEGDDLDALALDLFGLERIDAVGSVGTLTFTRGGSSGTVTIPAGTRVSGTVNGATVQVATDADADLLSGTSTVDVTATAVDAGPEGNVAAGVLTTIDDVVAGDTTMTVTNAARFVGGANSENDDAFRARIRLYFSTLRRGTVAALRTGALSVPGVSYVTVDESYIAPDDGGYVGVYVGDPDGRGNAALAADVEIELDLWRAAGVDVRVTASSRDEIAMTVVVTYAHGADTDTLRTQVRQAVLAYTNSLAPKQTLRESRVEAAVHALGSDVVSVAMTTPSGDYTPTSPYQAVRVNAADLTITLVEES